jgi:ATP/maltotriose-dependent transcriptional regulator MalT
MPNLWLSFAIGMYTGMAIAGARCDRARELIAEMEANHHFYEGTCLQGLAEFFRAALALAQGDRAEAWRLLRETLRVSTIGLVRSNACLAAAWLACEDRLLHEVQGWLDQVPGWTAQHPEGIMALARYEFEKGHWDAAVARHAQYIEHWPCHEVTPKQRQLLDTYQQAATTRMFVAAPRLPQLLTLRI